MLRKLGIIHLMLIMSLAVTQCACSFDVGTVEIRLVYRDEIISGVSISPLDEESITKIRVRIEGDDMSSQENKFYLGDHEFSAFSDIPLGTNRVVTVEGINTGGTVQSRGISAPFETKRGNTKIYLFISVVGKFAAPPLVGTNEKEFQDLYWTETDITRVFHTSTLLPNGEVLVVGGAWHPNPNGYLDPLGEAAIRTAERFDPTAGAFVRGKESPNCYTMKMCMLSDSGRAFHRTELLSSGSHLLVSGGEPLTSVQKRPAEYYSIDTGTFDNFITMGTPRSRHASAKITGASEGVLVAAGIGGSPARNLATIEVFENGNFETLEKTLSVPRSGAVAISYEDNVLVIGGWEAENTASKWVDRIEFSGEGQTDVTSFEMVNARAEHSAVLVEDSSGNMVVFVCGGLQYDEQSDPTVVDNCEFLYPSEGRASEIPGVTLRRWSHTATVLHDGSVLIAGGFSYYGNSITAEGGAVLFATPIGVARSKIVPMVSPRAGHTATLLASGMVVVIGGVRKIDITGALPGITFPNYYYEIFNPRIY